MRREDRRITVILPLLQKSLLISRIIGYQKQINENNNQRIFLFFLGATHHLDILESKQSLPLISPGDPSPSQVQRHLAPRRKAADAPGIKNK